MKERERDVERKRARDIVYERENDYVQKKGRERERLRSCTS